MADENRAEVSIGAKVDEAIAGIAALNTAFGKFASDTKESFTTLGSVSEKLTGKITELVKAFVGFEAIRRSVGITKDLGIETEKVAERLGISQSAASQFAIAMDDIYYSVDAALGVMQRQNRQMKSNEDAMNALGLVTRNSKGDFLSQQEIFLNSVEVLKQYQAGTDRNRAAMVLFGGRVGDLTALMRYSNEVQADAKVKADALGLTMTTQGVAAVSKYRAAMNDVGDVMRAFAKVTGEAVMPIIASLGEWFVDMGPAALQVFGAAVKTVVQILDTLFAIIQQLAELFVGFFRLSTVGWTTIGDVINRVLQGDIVGAKDAIARGATSVEDEFKRMHDRMDKGSKDFVDRYKARWGDGIPTAEPTGGKKFEDPGEALKAQQAALENQIALIAKGREIISSYLKGEVAERRMTEEEKLEIERLTAQQAYETTRRIMEQKLALAGKNIEVAQKERSAIMQLDAQHVLDVQTNQIAIREAQSKTRDLEIENMRAELDRFRYNADERIRVLKAVQAATEANHPDIGGQTDPKVLAARKAVAEEEMRRAETVVKMERQAQDAATAIALKGLDDERGINATRYSLLEISKLQELALDQAIEQQRYELQMEAVDKEIAAVQAKRDANNDYDLQAEQGLLEKKTKLQSDYQSRVGAITAQAVVEQRKYAVELQKSFQDNVGTLFEDFIKGTKIAAQAFRDFATSVIGNIARIMSQRIAERLVGAGSTGGSILEMIAGVFGATGGMPATGAASTAAAGGTGLTIPMQNIPRFAAGISFVPRDMLAFVHQGERISTPDMRGAGASVTVNFNGVTDASSFRASQGEILASLGGAVNRALARNR